MKAQRQTEEEDGSQQGCGNDLRGEDGPGHLWRANAVEVVVVDSKWRDQRQSAAEGALEGHWGRQDRGIRWGAERGSHVLSAVVVGSRATLRWQIHELQGKRLAWSPSGEGLERQWLRGRED